MTKDGLKFENVTIDDLAGMMMRGFAEVRNYMDERFASLEKRFDISEQNAEARFNRIEADAVAVGQTVYKDHAPRIERVEHKLKIA